MFSSSSGLASDLIQSVKIKGARGVPYFEAPYEAKFEEGLLKVRVESKGCTDKSNFALLKVGTSLALVRRQGDSCKAFVKEGVWITFTSKELGLQKEKYLDLVNVASSLPLSTK